MADETGSFASFVSGQGEGGSFADFVASQPKPVSAVLPTSAQASAVAEENARQLTQALTAPPVPKNPAPHELRGYTPEELAAPSGAFNPRTGKRYSVGAQEQRIPIIDAPIEGVGNVAAGVERMAQPGMRAKAGGLSKIIGGGLQAAEPLMAGMGVVAPVDTALALGGGMLAQEGTQRGLHAAGVPEEYSDLAGQVAGLVGGGLAAKGRGSFAEFLAKRKGGAEGSPLPDGRGSTAPEAETVAGREPAPQPGAFSSFVEQRGGPAATSQVPGAASGVPAPGTVAQIPTDQISVDPARFQFKSNVGKGGAGDEFRGVTKFDPEKSGILSVWHDPADGKTYVVNGHHRLEMAQRLGEPTMTARYLDAADAQEARTKGALINIAEGRGDSLDAAKVFRDSGLDSEALEREGVSLKGEKAREGLALANLDPFLFQKVVSGELPKQRAAVIGEGVENPDDQRALYDLLADREKNGKRLTNDQVGEMIRLSNAQPQITETQDSLFGPQEMTRGLIPEKAEVSDYVQRRLGQERKLFAAVSNEAAATKLGEAGNVIQAGENASVAERTSQAQVLYDKLSTTTGPVSDALDEAAAAIAKGDSSNGVKERAYSSIKASLLEQAARLAGEGGRAGERPEANARGGTGAARAGELGEPRAEEAAAVERPAVAAGPEEPTQPESSTPQDLRERFAQSGAGKPYRNLSYTQRQAVDKMVERQMKNARPLPDGRGSEARPALAEKTEPQQPNFDEAENPAPPRPTLPEGVAGSGLGALDPYLKESVGEMAAMRAKRAAALAELDKAKATPEEQGFGKRVTEYFTGERDLWGTRVNQAIARLRRMVPDPVDQEALALMRDFKNKPGEMEAFLDGTHPSLGDLDLFQKEAAERNIERLRPAIEKALNPTARMLQADAKLTEMSAATLREGQRLGFLESRWTPDEYVPHILHPEGDGEVPSPAADRIGRALGGKIGRYFSFAETRNYPTLLEAVANNVKPKTLNALDAFTIHGDKFATARATHLMVNQLRDTGVGKWGARENAPKGWVEIAPHAHPFQQMVPYQDAEGAPQVAKQTLFVPGFIEKALQPITDPDYLGFLPGFRKLRVFQAYTKAVQLGLSMFHATTENYMALANMGPRGWVRGLRADRTSAEFLNQERDFILHGGTTSIQGNTVEAYKALEPGSIPTWSDIWRRAPGVREMDRVAGLLTDFTFGKLQRQFKVTDYALHKAAWLGKNPGATADATATAMHSITKEVNAVYGGLHTENLGINKATVELARAVMLAPDWTFSNVFNVKYAAERGTPAGKLARAFWMRQIAGGVVATQALSLAMSRKLSKNPTQVYMGTDSKGKEIYQNVFFKGVAGDVLNLVHNVYDYGAVAGLARSMTGKAAPVVRAGLQLATNRDYLGREIVPKGMNPVAGTVRGGIEVAKSLAPVPLSVGNVHDMLLGPKADQYSIPEFLTTIFAGNPPRHVAPGGGRPRGAERSVVDQIRTGKVYK